MINAWAADHDPERPGGPCAAFAQSRADLGIQGGQLAARSGKLIVHIEGLIGSGKTTLCTELEKHYARDPSVAVLLEPSYLWERCGVLEAFYNKELPPVGFQMAALTTRFTGLLDALDDPQINTIVCERSMQSDREVFAATTLTTFAELNAYNMMYTELLCALGQLHYSMIYLDASNETLSRHVTARNRLNGVEKEAVTDAYTEKLRQAHAAMISRRACHGTVPNHAAPSTLTGGEPLAELLEKAVALIDYQRSKIFFPPKAKKQRMTPSPMTTTATTKTTPDAPFSPLASSDGGR